MVYFIILNVNKLVDGGDIELIVMDYFFHYFNHTIDHKLNIIRIIQNYINLQENKTRNKKYVDLILQGVSYVAIQKVFHTYFLIYFEDSNLSLKLLFSHFFPCKISFSYYRFQKVIKSRLRLYLHKLNL